MKREKRIGNLPIRVTFFIGSDGMVTIADLFAEVLPLALSLNPEDKRIEKFISYQIKREEGERREY